MTKKDRRQKPVKAEKKRRPLLKARFSVGSQVVVRQGIADPDYPDIPLGGWVGTIAKVDYGATPLLYLIEWNQPTLNQINPVVAKRCDRDGFESESMWLQENEIELYEGQPRTVEQPQAIATNPLSVSGQDDRIKMVVGLTSDDPVPDVQEATLLRYYRYLTENLSFPFEAEYSEETADGFITHRVQVLQLLDPNEFDDDDFYGLLCEAREGRYKLYIPFAEVEVKKKDTNYRLVSDYSYWFWNWR